jgi:predicted phage baseplate assembly protein
MPLPTPMLDDRRFQDLVDQAKRMIPQYCPEWTDHNVSDPGVTLIELFAWMTDLLLYRVNQVPDKVYLHFLELIGVRLEPPRAARAPVTFYLSVAQPNQVTIPRETEVATVRTETSPAIIFTTEQDLIIRPAVLSGAYTRSAGRGGSGWLPHDLRQLGLLGRKISIFPPQLGVGDAFYLAFADDLSQHVLGLVLDCEVAGGAGIDPNNPPFEWQVWQGGLARWVNCEVEFDGTGGFNQPGEVVLHLPLMARDDLQGVSAFWLRCRLTEAQAGDGGYRESPALNGLIAESRGGTVGARHAVTVLSEALGRSDGTPGQSFRLINAPILARDPDDDRLLVAAPGGEAQPWQEVADFGASGPGDLHYTLDSSDGSVRLGPSLLQPDGTVYRFGATPPHGSELSFSRYQYGGGVIGNLPQAMLAVLKSGIPYVARVSNRAPAAGGQDAQSLQDAITRAPNMLRLRTRAVTADDYEYLAGQVPSVARACCLAPAAQPGSADDPRPGSVVMLVLPQVAAVEAEILPEQLTLSAELRGAVQSYLSERSLVTTRLEVRAPQYIYVSVQARLRLPQRSSPGMVAETQRRAEAALYRYLNPFIGGPDGQGWPFGRDLHVSEVYGLLQRIPLIEFVEEVQISVREPGRTATSQPVLSRLEIPPAGLICSYQHRVTVGQ